MIKYVLYFIKDYTKKISKTDESYLNAFHEIKSNLGILEKKIQYVNYDHVATKLTIVKSTVKKHTARQTIECDEGYWSFGSEVDDEAVEPN